MVVVAGDLLVVFFVVVAGDLLVVFVVVVAGDLVVVAIVVAEELFDWRILLTWFINGYLPLKIYKLKAKI